MRTAILILLGLAAASPARSAQPQPPRPDVLYSNGFEHAEEGKVPDDMLVLDGNFAVKKEGDNKLLEVPGAPLKSFGILLGEEGPASASIQARIRSNSTGRRMPEFGVGLGGAGGMRLWLMPAVGQLQVVSGDEREVKAAMPYNWTPGSWTIMRLHVRAAGEGKWVYEGKAWQQGQPEPSQWMISAEVSEEPMTGRPSIWGIPYSEKPIAFDDVAVYGRK